MIQLEAYKGMKTRHTCPACNSQNCFVRYIGEDGNYLSQDVGRCNRESKCGYHYSPKQFFADNPQMSETIRQYKKPNNRFLSNYGFADKKELPREMVKPDYIPFDQFKKTLGNYERNNFVQFLLNLFPNCAEEIAETLKIYFVGTYENYTCFPSIDRSNRICRAKLIRFNPANGKRLKGEFDTSSLPAKLKLKDFNYKQIFFGEHLLNKFPEKPVAIVESEKTAIIASLCFSEFIWLGCHSKTWLKLERLKRLVTRKIILYPDADGFDLWRKIALNAKRQGLDVQVSSLIETRGTGAEKDKGSDLADYLISEQNEINDLNNFVNTYNAKLEKVLKDETLQNDFDKILDQQKAVLIDRGMSDREAEKQITNFDNLRQIVMNI